MELGTIIKKVRRNIRDNGLWLTLRKSLGALGAFVYESRVYRIYRRDLDPETIMDQLRDHPFEMRLLEYTDDTFIKQVEDMEEWLDGAVGAMLESGSICVAAIDKDIVAGFNLISVGEVYMPIVKMKRLFRPDEAWSEQITVHPDYRGQGLATILRQQAFVELAEKGVKRFYGGTLPANVPNRKLSKKVGFREIADIRYRKFLSSRRWSWSRVRDEI